eukprot:TRINITY_DN2408_c2_g1_i2.p1 TRINITY_DN2408_c2_g1~~TRINITY_DN2408_c2_g1_i2.p1  ORF type:complete len:190 (-),score=-12.94 TRINITY_DN2408_c2_g1_i2:177-746(-)
MKQILELNKPNHPSYYYNKLTWQSIQSTKQFSNDTIYIKIHSIFKDPYNFLDNTKNISLIINKQSIKQNKQNWKYNYHKNLVKSYNITTFTLMNKKSKYSNKNYETILPQLISTQQQSDPISSKYFFRSSKKQNPANLYQCGTTFPGTNLSQCGTTFPVWYKHDLQPILTNKTTSLQWNLGYLGPPILF